MLICDNDQTLANDNERVLIVFQIYYHTTKMAAPAILCHGSLSLSLSLSLALGSDANYLFTSASKLLARFSLCK